MSFAAEPKKSSLRSEFQVANLDGRSRAHSEMKCAETATALFG
jgi:hypothetical protein